MDFADWIDRSFFNFFSIGALSPAVFSGLIGFFLLRVPNKSGSTRWLGLAIFIHSLFEMGYAAASTVFLPELAFHRWVTFGTVLLLGTIWCVFWFHFPERTHPRSQRVVISLLALIALLMDILFAARTYNAPRIYHFEGHYWDFAADDISRTGGLVIFGYVLLIGMLGIWRGIVSPEVRWSSFAMALAWVGGIIPPGILNVLSREGAVGHDLYQTVRSLSNLLAFFIIFIVYLNTTRDRTTFMTKLVAICAATFLVVLQGVTYVTLRHQDRAYDAVHRRDADRAIFEGARPADLRYVLRLETDGGYTSIYQTDGATVNSSGLRPEHENTLTRERIAAAPAPDWRTQVTEVLDGAPAAFGGYAAVARQFLEQNPGNEITVRDNLLERIDALERIVLYRYNKLRKLPDDAFRDQALELLGKESGTFAPFAAFLVHRIENSSLQGAALKSEVLAMLAPCAAAGTRNYRWHTHTDLTTDPYVSFMLPDRDLSVLYEVGFSYLALRAFVHEAARDLVLILCVTMGILLILFPLFFAGILVRPLDRLLRGVQQVNEGDFTVKVPVGVEDEIGFLSRSFNGMVSSIRGARQKLQDYADNLEERVRERTAELKKSLDQVQRLKKQQDGDYFLTSLLVKPLSSNKADSPNVKVDFLLKQKKQFRFRRWNAEIGGDLCSSDRIDLNGEYYTVFLNADAMGKSIQGAGGTIVLGSVFESILSRTKISDAARRVYPERWLKNAFIEMHKVFESFDGSMLISLVMGLIHEQSGFLYYINAEHPFSVLYRNGQAEFIEKELLFRKIGFTGLSRGMHIQTFQLLPDDVLIAGSDGRDDLEISVSESGRRVINEDENQFRIIVEEGNADLEQIYRLLMASGELTDDLSLVRMQYTGPGIEVGPPDPETRDLIGVVRKAEREGRHGEAIGLLEQGCVANPQSLRIRRELVGLYYRQQKYEQALEILRGYVHANPGDTEMLYMAAVLAKRLHKHDYGIDLGERVRLREPGHVRNLVNLANLYLNAGNARRSEHILSEAIAREPNNRAAAKLRAHLDERSL